MFEGWHALVTGAASGMGKATAIALASKGAAVVIADLDLDGATRAAKEIEERGGSALPIQVDVADSAQVRACCEKALSWTGGRMEILVNNAGYEKPCPVDQMSDEDWHRMIAVHLDGAFYFIRSIVPAMKAQRFGKIVNMSSTYGLVGWENEANYSAAKAGLLGLTKALAKELAPYRINVNALAPGSVMTPIQRVIPKEVIEERMRTIPWKRYAEPEEIAEIICFLCSPKADYITGQVLSPNGGSLIVGI